MNPTIIRLLQHIESYGLHTREGRWTCYAGLPWYKRLVNWMCAKIGAPYIDPFNYSKTILLPLTDKERAEVNHFLWLNAPKPRCRSCGSGYLEPDPHGYYEHATDYRGAPLLCPSCAGD